MVDVKLHNVEEKISDTKMLYSCQMNLNSNELKS